MIDTQVGECSAEHVGTIRHGDLVSCPMCSRSVKLHVVDSDGKGLWVDLIAGDAEDACNRLHLNDKVTCTYCDASFPGWYHQQPRMRRPRQPPTQSVITKEES
jgi:hypothetical protein